MTALLIVLTVLEILVVVVVLAVYLTAIARSLQRTATLLGKVSFGVRAIETECAPIGPVVTTINTQLAAISGALASVTALAESKASGVRSDVVS